MESLKANFKKVLGLVADYYFELDLSGTPLQQIRVLESSGVNIDWIKFIPYAYLDGVIYIYQSEAHTEIDPQSMFEVLRRVFTVKKNRRERFQSTTQVIPDKRGVDLQDEILFLARMVAMGKVSELLLRGHLYKHHLDLIEDFGHLIGRLILKIPKTQI